MAVLARLTGLQRMIRAWRTDQPTELASQLEEHQREVDEALRRVGAGAWPRLAERAVAGGTHTAKLGELLLVETTTRDAEVKLPEVTGDVLGSVCGVAKLQTTNEVRVSVPRGRIDGSTGGVTLTAVGMRLFVATTKGWWSVGGDAEGTYSPDYSAGSGIDLTNPRNASFRWHLTGNAMHVDGRVTVDLDSPSGEKEFRISLPRAPRADFADSTDAHGSGSMVASSLASDCQAAMVEAVASTSLVRVVSTSADTSGARAFRFHFVYSP